jgi:hypothetical protein
LPKKYSSQAERINGKTQARAIKTRWTKSKEKLRPFRLEQLEKFRLSLSILKIIDVPKLAASDLY